MQIENQLKIQQIEIHPLETSSNSLRYILLLENRYFEVSRSVVDLIQMFQQSDNYQDVILLYKEKYNKIYTVAELGVLVEKYINPILNSKQEKKHSFLYKKEIFSFQNIITWSNSLKFLFNIHVLCILLLVVVALEFCFFFNDISRIYSSDFTLYTFLELLVLFLVSSLTHELGHAVACRYFGVKHGGIGIGLYLNFPVFYTDVSNIWILSRKQRLVINFAGVYFQLILLLPILLLYFYTNDVFLKYFIFIVNMNFLVTLNPFFKFDGYWIVSDLLGVPNLRKRTTEIFTYYWKKMRRREPVDKPFIFSMRKIEKLFMVIYTLVVNIFLGYYCVYLIPLFLYYFGRTFPAHVQQLIFELAAGKIPDYQLINLVIVKLIFFLCIIYLLTRIILKYVRKYRIHQINMKL